MSDSHPNTEPAGTPPGCVPFQQLVNQFLDGEIPAGDLTAHPHSAGCPECRSVSEAAEVLLGGLRQRPLVVPPPGFAGRVTRAAHADFHRRKRQGFAARVVGAGALAAGVIVGATLVSPRSPLADRGVFARWWPSAQPVVNTPAPLPGANEVANSSPPSKGESISGRLSEAGSAVVSLTRKAGGDSLAPARDLLTPPPAQPTALAPPNSPADPLTELPGAAKAGLEPLTDTARRAVNLFIRDVGSAAGAGKSKS